MADASVCEVRANCGANATPIPMIVPFCPGPIMVTKASATRMPGNVKLSLIARSVIRRYRGPNTPVAAPTGMPSSAASPVARRAILSESPVAASVRSKMSRPS